MQEYGPFVYRESDTYSEPQEWDVPTSVPGKPDKKNGIKMIMNQLSHYDKEHNANVAEEIDLPLWQVNQAAQGVWYAATNTPNWRIYLNVSKNLINNLASLCSCSRWSWKISCSDRCLDSNALHWWNYLS